MKNTKITITSEDIIGQIIAKHCKGKRAIESALFTKQQTHTKSKSKQCTNCKRTNHTVSKWWEEGGGNHMNALNWIRKSDGDKSKKKKGKDKAYMLKEDSGSKTVAATLNPTKPGNMDGLLTLFSDCMEDRYMSYVAQEPTNEKVPVAWNQDLMCGLIAEEMPTISSINNPFVSTWVLPATYHPSSQTFSNSTLSNPKRFAA